MQSLAVMRELGMRPEITNVNGGDCSGPSAGLLQGAGSDDVAARDEATPGGGRIHALWVGDVVRRRGAGEATIIELL